MQTKTNERSLPQGWQWVKLGDVCGFLDSRRKPINETERTKRIQGKKENELYPYYGANGQVGWIDGYLFDEPLILLAEDGGFFGSKDRPIAYSVSGKYWVNNHAHVLRPRSEIIDFDFCLHSLRIRPDVGQMVAGATRAKLNQETALSIPIALPPLDEQRRIAGRLNEQLAAVESARKAAKEQLQAARKLPSTYLQELFGDSAKHKWNWQKLGEVCELLPSRTIKSIGDTVVTAITTACLSENGFLPAGLKTSRMDANDAKQALVKEGEILIARSNTPDLVGRVSIYLGNPPNVVASDLTIRIWAGSSCHPPFLTAYLSYLYLSCFWKEVAGGASGSMKKITRTQVLLNFDKTKSAKQL